MTEFVTKDSGERQVFASGMQRDTGAGKIDYTYCLQGPMLDRWAQLMERGAKKYDRDNWMLAAGEAELQRFKTSALRHMIQWLRGDTDEDHAAAVIFNLNGAEYVKGKMATPKLKLQHLCIDAVWRSPGETIDANCVCAGSEEDSKYRPKDYRWVPA